MAMTYNILTVVLKTPTIKLKCLYLGIPILFVVLHVPYDVYPTLSFIDMYRIVFRNNDMERWKMEINVCYPRHFI